VVPDLDAMVQAVRRFKQDEALWREEGRRAADYVARHHAVGAVVDVYERIFERMLAPAAPALAGGTS